MKNKKFAVTIDRLIMGIFIAAIVMGSALNIYVIMYKPVAGADTDWMPVIVSMFFLCIYITSRRYYSHHFKFLPQSYYYIAMSFAVLSVYLGSYLNFYEAIPWWDTMLHFASGILLGLMSIILVSFIVKSRFGEFKNSKDIIFLVIVGVLVSISIAVFWEFYEFTFDYITDGNMQRSIIVENASEYDFSQHLRPSGRFIDEGLKDTMKDQLLAVAGAIIAGIYSYYHFNAIQLNICKDEECESK